MPARTKSPARQERHETDSTSVFSRLSTLQSCAGDAPFSYQPLLRLTTFTTPSITGTSISTPTTVASAAPDWKPNSAIAAATASSKKLDAPISADGPATLCCSPTLRLSQ